MMNTVPAGVELSEPIVLMERKVNVYSYDISADGVVSISGRIRVCSFLGHRSGLTSVDPLRCWLDLPYPEYNIIYV